MRLLSRRAAAVLLVAISANGGAVAETLRLEQFNRTYSDLAGELAPLRFDPVTIRLASPRQTVIVRDHLVTLEPLGGGRFLARLEIDLSGKGELVADVDFGGSPQRMTDTLVLPQQKLRLDAKVAIVRQPGGYRVTALEAPSSLPIEIRSKLVGDLLDSCASLAMLSLGALDCAPIIAALERPRLPLPGPGAEQWLADADLSATERASIDALLARNR